MDVLRSHCCAVRLVAGTQYNLADYTDQGEEGQFVWMSSGKPLSWENWNAGEPNNYE